MYFSIPFLNYKRFPWPPMSITILYYKDDIDGFECLSALIEKSVVS